MTHLLAHERMTLGVATPRIGIDGLRRPSRYLTIDGAPAYQIGYSCGTCGLVLRREPGASTMTASAAAVRDRLNAGLDGLDAEVVDAFAGQLPRGDYLVMLLDVRPRLVPPGSAEDYFTTDGPAGWRNEESGSAIDPTNINYYRLGDTHISEHDELFEFMVPMTDPTRLDRATTARYADPVGQPTAVAFGLLDIEGPWSGRVRHWGLFHFLLDGHHKTAAAAAAGHPVRLLSFVSVGGSLATDEELLRLPTLLPGYVYFASLVAGRTRDNPAGVIRRRIIDGVPVDEAFTRNLRWETTAVLRIHALGYGDYEFEQITAAEAEAFVRRVTAKLGG